MIPAWLRREEPAGPPDGPLWVDLSAEQPHPIDLRWADELMASAGPHLMVRPEDELLILVPNRPIKVNATALRVLGAMVEEGQCVAEVLRREGDSPRKRRELHYFFSDLRSWLSGALGEGQGRRAVVREPFSADFCRYPVIAEVALTYRCNLACAFCYAGCAAAGLPEGWSEERTMSGDEVCRVLDRIRHEAQCPSVSFTGGEPTTRRALPRFVRHAKDLGMKVNLISNAQLLSERLVGRLADAGLDSAQLSLEGPTAEVHDGIVAPKARNGIRARRGAFDRLWAASVRLREHGIRVHTNTTINRRNLPHLEAIVDLIAERGHDRLTMNLVIPCGTAAGTGDDLLVPYSRVGDHLLKVQERAAEREVEFIWYSPIPACLFSTVAHGLGNQGCAAADGLLHVNPAGDVLPCSSFQHGENLGNLLRQPFEEVWESHSARFFRQKAMMPPSCRSCANRELCQGACPLYWREVGLVELGGAASDRPPLPEGFGCGGCAGSSADCSSTEGGCRV
ncbi:MAG: radical SAM protein [bacterium]|nr:radical SAM protein [bacterium]